MIASRTLPVAALAIAAAVAGCNNYSTRTREKSNVYQSLPTETRQRLQHRHIGIGDSQDMVYIALGYPDEVRQLRTVQGEQTAWVYRTYWQQYEGSAWVGWHRAVVPMRGGGFAIVHEPVSTDVYRMHVDEAIRVTFDHGVVTAVEQQEHG